MKFFGTPYLLYGFLLSFALERGIFILFLENVGLSSTEISTLQVCFFVSCFLAEVPTGMLSDLFGKKTALIMGSISMALGVGLSYLFRESFWLMLLAFIVHATAFALVSGAVTALMYDELKKLGHEKKYPALLSSYNFLQSIGLGLAMWSAGRVFDLVSWEGLYYLSAVIQGLSALAVFGMAETRHKPNQNESFFKGFFSGSIELLPIIVPISLVHAAMTPYFVFSQKLFKGFDINVGTISTIMASVEILSSIGVLLFAKLAPRFSKGKLRALLVGFSSLLAVHYFIESNQTWLITSIIVFFIANAIVMYIQVISDSYYQSCIKSEFHRSSIMSFTAFIDTAMIGFGYILFGFGIDLIGINLTFAFSALLPLASLILVLKGKTYAKI